MLKESEDKIKKIMDEANNLACVELDFIIKQKLKAIKQEQKYDSINMITGMGTTSLIVMDRCQEYSETENDFPVEVFEELNDFIKLMAGTHNIYPTKDILV